MMAHDGSHGQEGKSQSGWRWHPNLGLDQAEPADLSIGKTSTRSPLFHTCHIRRRSLTSFFAAARANEGQTKDQWIHVPQNCGLQEASGENKKAFRGLHGLFSSNPDPGQAFFMAAACVKHRAQRKQAISCKKRWSQIAGAKKRHQQTHNDSSVVWKA